MKTSTKFILSFLFVFCAVVSLLNGVDAASIAGMCVLPGTLLFNQVLTPQINLVQQQTFALGDGEIILDKIKKGGLLRRLWIKVDMNLTGGLATSSFDGANAIFQNIDFSASLDGRDINPVKDLSLGDLMTLMQFRKKIRPREWPNYSTTGYKELGIPIDFLRPTFPGWFQFACCIPTWRCSNLTLRLMPATTAQIDTAVTPTFAGTFTVSVYQETYEQASLPIDAEKNVMVIPWLESMAKCEKRLSTTDYATGNVDFRLTAGSLYAGLYIRAIASATSMQLDATAQNASAPFDTTTGKHLILNDLSEKPKQKIPWILLRDLVYDALVDDNDRFPDGVAGFPFEATGTNGLFNTIKVASQESNIVLNADVRSSTGGQIRFIEDMIMDPSNLLGLLAGR